MKQLLLLFFLLFVGKNTSAQHRFMKYYDNKIDDKIADLSQDFVELSDSGLLFSCISIDIFREDTLGYAKTYLMVVRVNKDGDTLFQKVYKKPNYAFKLRNIVATNDGNFLLVGNEFDLVKYDKDTIGSKILLIKINVNGDTLWSKKLDIGDGDEFANRLINTNDGGYAILGQVCDKLETNCDMYLMKLDSNANMEWYKTYTWGINYWENPTSFIQTRINEYVISSATRLKSTNVVSPYIVKVSSSGILLWQKKLSNEGSNYAYFEDIIEYKDDSLIFVGVFGDNLQTYPITKGWIVKTDSSGIVNSNKKIGEENKYTFFYNLVISNSNIVIQGATNSYSKEEYQGRTSLYAFDYNLNKLWRRIYQDSILPNQTYITYNMKATNDGGYAMIGFGRDPNAVVSSQDVWLIKVDSMGCLVDNCLSLGYAEELQPPNYFNVYPNPSNGIISLSTNTTIKILGIYNLMGVKVKEITFSEDEKINLVDLPKGIYFIKAIDQLNNLFIDKFILY